MLSLTSKYLHLFFNPSLPLHSKEQALQSVAEDPRRLQLQTLALGVLFRLGLGGCAVENDIVVTNEVGH